MEGPTAETYAVTGRLVLGDALVEGAVVVEGDRIVEVVRSIRRDQLPATRLNAPIVAPGLIDLQVNGGFGVEFGGDPAAYRRLAARLPETGVTSFLPTLISSPLVDYSAAFAALAAIGSVDGDGARPLGLHLEGPFLSPRRTGAHPPEAIAADDALPERLIAEPGLRLMTVAPERAGGLELIRRLHRRVPDRVVVSLGHTDASYEEFVAGIDAGATMATHLFNAMSPFAHRFPGAIGAALTDERVTVGLIADGVHCHPASLRLALAAKGPDRVALVSDMMAAAGMGPGAYTLGGRRVIVDAGSARLEDGTLAGSILTLDRAVHNLVALAGASPAAALRSASEVPARVLGLDRIGRIAVGATADLALFDDDFAPVATIVGGRVVYRR